MNDPALPISKAWSQLITITDTRMHRATSMEVYNHTWEGNIFTPRISLNSRALLDSGIPPPRRITRWCINCYEFLLPVCAEEIEICMHESIFFHTNMIIHHKQQHKCSAYPKFKVSTNLRECYLQLMNNYISKESRFSSQRQAPKLSMKCMRSLKPTVGQEQKWNLQRTCK